MNFTCLLIFLIGCFALTSASIYGVEIDVSDDWWSDNYFLKFNTPSGKIFFIDNYHGLIHRKEELSLPPDLPLPPPPLGLLQPPKEEKALPYITFVAINFKIYDIYIDAEDVNYIPKIVETEFRYQSTYFLIRHRLKSFVGPNKQVYDIIYDVHNASDITISAIRVGELDHFQIKTFGPYDKWEHNYEFSETGEFATDHFRVHIGLVAAPYLGRLAAHLLFVSSVIWGVPRGFADVLLYEKAIAPVMILPNRSIILPEVTASSLLDKGYGELLVDFKASSNKKYHITDRLNIVKIHDDLQLNDGNSNDGNETIISFIEPDGRRYNILFTNNELGYHSQIVEDEKIYENFFRESRLSSFVGPNKILYIIRHKNDSDHEVPILMPALAHQSLDLQITIETPSMYSNHYVKYVFSENGEWLFDREDYMDWTPINELPGIPLEEVEADSKTPNSSFLTFNSPSGKIYHLKGNGSEADIVVERLVNKNAHPAYISFFHTNGRKAHIYLSDRDHPYLEMEETGLEVEAFTDFLLVAFTTPDKKKYTISSLPDDQQTPYVELPFQVEDPIDTRPEDTLSIHIQSMSSGEQYFYQFSWDGRKTLSAMRLPPQLGIPNRVLKSLIGR